MAVTITDRRTILSEVDSTTGITGASGTTTSDIAEATAAVRQAINIGSGSIYFTTGTAINLSNTLVYVYAFNNALQPAWDASPPPMALFLGDGTDQIAFDMAGNNRRVFNHLDGPTSWQCLVLDGSQASTMNSAGNTYVVSGSFANLGLTAITQVGAYFVTESKALAGGYNVALDIIRYGNLGIRITGGGSGTEGKFSEIAVADRSTANQAAHGILRAYTTIAFGVQGPLTFGDSGSATNSYFEDSGVVVVYEDRNISNDKYFFNVEGNSGSTNYFVLTGSTITTAGPFVTMNFASGNINTLTFDGVSFISLGNAITFSGNADASGHSVTSCTFDGCGQVSAGLVTFTDNSILNSTATNGAVVAGGGDMRRMTVSGYEGTADTSALIYNVAADPDGELDGSIFTKGTAATHAIQFGTSTPTTITLRNMTFSGYNASNGQNDSTFYFAATAGTYTVNLAGCSGNLTYKSAGATINLVINPVTTTITVRDVSTGSIVQGARVYVEADAGGGISQGTVIINALTDVNGQVSDTRSLSQDQPITGWVRKGTTSPLYQQGNVAGTIDSETGLNLTIQLVPDE